MYEYRASVLRVVDGDTVDVRVDLGFDVRMDMRLRLLGINAPERYTERGPAATAHLLGMLAAAGLTVTVRTEKDRKEKYGRYLATLLLPDGTNVNERMLADGHAVPMAG